MFYSLQHYQKRQFVLIAIAAAISFSIVLLANAFFESPASGNSSLFMGGVLPAENLFLLMIGQMALATLLMFAFLSWGLNKTIGNHQQCLADLFKNFANRTAPEPDWRDEQHPLHLFASQLDQMSDVVKRTPEQETVSSTFDKQDENRQALKERDELERQQEREIVSGSFSKALSALASRDLSYRITEAFPKSDEKLKSDFNEAIEQLSTTIDSIGLASGQILSGSNEIHDAAHNLATRTEHQAATIEEAAAALEKTTSAMQISTERAKDASVLVETAKDNAERSGQIVQDAIEAMGEIESSAQQINNIISIIDDIAFQTNLLALNAGVEAARAGEAGRGFAVVAQEVRQLAQRSASAAKDIKNLITTSGKQVKMGVSLVNNTGSALEKIVEEVTEINEHVSAIVSAASKQSMALTDINQSVMDIDRGTQQNAAVAEESTAASYALTEEVSNINQMLNGFNTTRIQNHSRTSSRNQAA